MATASCSFSFQCLATFSAKGSSGLGALKSACMLQHEIRRHIFSETSCGRGGMNHGMDGLHMCSRQG